MAEPRYTPGDEITDETGRVVVRCVQEIITNVTVICGSCAAGDHACGGDCSCARCTGVINGMEPTP